MPETEYPLMEAASRLGTSEGALRKRLKRNPGAMPHRIDERGRIWISLDEETHRTGGDPNVRLAVAEALVEELRRENAVLTRLLDGERARVDSLLGGEETA